MAYRNCKASIQLGNEIKQNPEWSHRDWSSDGTLGDAAHAARHSDHNPWLKDSNGVGVIRARDIDEDLDGDTRDTGADALVLFNHLLTLAKNGDVRLNGGGYLIYEGKIYSEKSKWQPRVYTGVNAHKKHIHVSFSQDPRGYDSTAPWGVSTLSSKPKPEGGFLMALTEEQQKNLYELTQQNAMRIAHIEKMLMGEEYEAKGDVPKRTIASLTRIEKRQTDG